MDPRQELETLRKRKRLTELEAKAGTAPVAEQSAAPVDKYAGMSAGDKFVNDAKIMGKGLLSLGAGVTEGVASLPSLIPDVGYDLYNRITGSKHQTPSQRLHSDLSTFAPEGAIRQSGLPQAAWRSILPLRCLREFLLVSAAT